MNNTEITRCYRELTLADVLSDPMIGAIMDADRVNRDEFARSLSATARVLRSRPRRDRRLRGFWPSTLPTRRKPTDDASQ
jgi:hypothetical protein